MEVRRVEGREPVHAEERHRDPDLVVEQLEHPDQAGLAGRGEAAAGEASDPNRLGAEGDRLDDVGSAHEAAVHDDRRPAADRPDDLRQHLDGAPAVIQLAPAVVRDVHAVDAVVDRERRVLGRRDPLQHERDRVRVLEALDVVPAEPRLELEAAGARPPRLDEAPGEVALAPAVAGGVHGEAEGGVAMVHGAPHPGVDPRVVAANVELEDAEVVRRRRDRLEARVADRAEHLGHPELLGRFGGRGAAALGEGLDGADGRQHEGQAHRPAKERGGRVDLRDVAEDAGPEGDRVECLPVAPQRRLGLRAADQVVPGAGRQVVAGRPDDLVERRELVAEIGGHARSRRR